MRHPLRSLHASDMAVTGGIRGPRHLIAGLLSVLVAMLLVLTGPLASPEASAAETPITEGSLTWGFKESWRSYISAGGTVVGTEGAAIGALSVATFPLLAGSYEDQSTSTRLEFGGTVHYEKYEGALDMTIARPIVELTPQGSTITAEVISRTMSGDLVDYGRIVVGLIDTESGVLERDAAADTTSWSSLATRLSQEVAPAFDSRYAVGSELDPLSIEYRGPGAKPVESSEGWDTPGALAYTLDEVQLGSFAIRPLTLTADGSAVLVVRSATSATAANQTELLALDPGTLEQIGDSYRVTTFGVSAYLSAHRETNTVFAYSSSSTIRRTVAVTWDPESQTFSQKFLSAARGIPDEVQTEILRVDTNTGTAYAVLYQGKGLAEFVQDAEGVWSRTSYLSTDAGSALAGVTLSGLAVTSDGTVIVTRNDGALPAAIVEVTAGGLVLTDIPGTDIGAAGITADAEGGFFLYGGTPSKLWHFSTAGARGYSASSPLVLTDTGTVSTPSGGPYNYDAESRTLVLLHSDAGSYATLVIHDGDLIGSIPAASNTATYLALDAEHYIASGVAGYLQRVTLVGTVPDITAQPTSATVVVTSAGGTASASFSVQATGTPEPSYQWQSRPAGSTSAAAWQDIAEATSADLVFGALEGDNGRQYRAIVSNEGGRIASDPVNLTVQSVPQLAVQPVSVTVPVGGSAQLSVMTRGNPEPGIVWETNASGSWQPLTASADIVIDGGFVTFANVSESLNGVGFRARLSNTVGTVSSDVATLTVSSSDAPKATTTYTGVVLEWTGSAEMQHQPPNGGAANYFSAGVSDGTKASYRATSAGVVIVQKDATGAESTASWATRGAHVTRGGSAVQLVRLTQGKATVEPDGSAVVVWPATFSVNFYDGLVPFTLSNPVLTVDAQGRGTLTADLSGYIGDMADPDKPKEAADSAAGVTVASFRNVVVDTRTGFTVRPDYEGVQISTPVGSTLQNRSVSGWGSWPQAFVDYHQATGLAGYFYSTGGVFDPNKAPHAFAVGFAGAIPQIPQAPEGGNTPDGGETPTVPSQPEVVDPATVEGSLLWGVKASFRSYVTGSIAKGSISVSGGAAAQAGRFWFGQTSTDWSAASGTGSTSYAGAVRFSGHSGVLNLTFANPVLRIESASRGTLSVAVNGSQVAIGSVDLGAATRSDVAGGVSYADAPVSLTAAGARVFSYGSSQFYAVGTALDPVTFVVGSAATGQSGSAVAVAAYTSSEWEPPTEAPASTGLVIAAGQLASIRPGSRITVTGDGFASAESGIKVVLYSEPVVLEKNLVADASGVATWTGVIPLTTDPGVHTLTFQGSQNLGIVITVLDEEPLIGCTIEDARLSWGFKESFRSYISGSIAHGEWQVSDGASYETPSFGWNAGEGVFDIEEFSGEVTYRGTVRFTGHDGLLDTTIANPTLRFTGPETAYLLLDVAGLTMEDAMAGNTENVLTLQQVPFVEIDLMAADVQVSTDGATVTVTEAPTAITAQGYEAFPNYEEGTAFDAVSFVLTTESECATAPAVTDDDNQVGTALEETTEPGWWWWVAGMLLLAVIVAVVIVILRRRAIAGAA